MPRVSQELLTLYLGVDPGVSGGFAVVGWQGRDQPHLVSTITESLGPCPLLKKMPEGERQVWDWMCLWKPPRWVQMRACIEQIDPRPAGWMDRSTGQWRQSILRSTCILYGNSMMLRGMLAACEMDYDVVPPRTWQGYYGLKKNRGETPSQWKNKLKAQARELYPDAHITLATADALLLAHYCRAKHLG